MVTAVCSKTKKIQERSGGDPIDPTKASRYSLARHASSFSPGLLLLAIISLYMLPRQVFARSLM